MSILTGLYNAQRGMTISQAGLSVVSNNIANMSTVGYSKQTLNTAALVLNSDPSNLTQVAEQGMGAYISSISRNREYFLDQNYRGENSDFNYYKDYSSMASMVESFTNDLDNTGLTKAMNGFYDAAQKLSSTPTDSVARINFVQQATNVTDYFNKVSGQLNDYRTSLVGDYNDASTFETSKANTMTETVNDLLSQVASVNKEIVAQSSNGMEPNGLLDKRDNLLDSLSQYVPITTKELINNGLQLSIGDAVMVKNGEQTAFIEANRGTSADNPAVVSIVDKDGDPIVSDVTKTLKTGSLAALLAMGGNDSSELSIKGVLDQLDNLASNFAGEVNAIQLAQEEGPPAKTSACLDDAAATKPALKTATENIFLNGKTKTTANITAANITINSIVEDNPNEIATAYVEATNVSTDPLVLDLVVNDPTQVGNNNTALKYADLRSKGLDNLDDLTTEKYLSRMIGDIGAKTETLNSNYETQSTVLDQAESTRTSAIGVNLDEELVDLIKYQRAYEASSKIFNVIDSIMQLTINMGG